jgi:hypothetical protein
MPTRRSVLKQGGCAILASAVPLVVRSVRAATSAPFDYYISTGGNDNNPGTLASPWSINSLNRNSGNNSKMAGKRIGLIQGTYGVYSLWQSASYSDPALHVPAGSSGAPTYVGSCDSSGNYLQGAAQITASPSGKAGGGLPGSSGSSVAIIGQYYAQANGYFTLDGLRVSDSNGYGLSVWSESGSTPGVTAQNCEIYSGSGSEGNNPGAVLLHGCVGAVINNCKIHDWQISGSGSHNCAGIFSFSCTGNHYTYNTIYNCNSCIYDKDNANGGHTYAYNYLECNGSNPQNCITNSGGGSVGQTRTVHHNILVAAGGSNTGMMLGINDSGPNYYTPYESMAFYNNTCYVLNGGSFQIGLMWQSEGNGVSPAASVKHFNNIWVSGNPGYGTVIFNPTGGAVALSNYNCYSGGSSSAMCTGNGGAPSATYSLSSWRSTMGQDANSLSPSSASGIFSSPGGAQNPAGYKLAGGSVCSGAGRTGGSSSGTACDLGAWGYDQALGAVPTQIGANLAAGTTTSPVPEAPVLKVS